MSKRRWKLVTADKSSVGTKPVLDAIVVEDLECNRCFSDSACTDESDRFKVFSEANDRLDKSIASETGPG